MRQNKLILPGLITLLLLLTVATVAASPAAQYAITNHSIDGGGHMHSGAGRFKLNSTFGQAESTSFQGASRFKLIGGYWGPDEASQPTHTPSPTPTVTATPTPTITPEPPGGTGDESLFFPVIRR